MGYEADVIILGAGPYGLSASAHLSECGLSTVVFGRVMDFWKRCMPRGMLLRSSWNASHVADPRGVFRLDAFQRATGAILSRPIPLDDFVAYSEWFAQNAVPTIDSRLVSRLDLSGNGFLVETEDGITHYSRHVVVATGIEPFARRPRAYSSLSKEWVSHACDHADLRVFAGKRLAIIGSGQSALESAALAQESGATVEVLCRKPKVFWLQRSMQLHQESLLRGLLYPPTDVGPPILNQIVARPHVLRRFPANIQERVARRSIRPAGAGWLLPRLSNVNIRTSTWVTQMRMYGGEVSLSLNDGSVSHHDHVLLATGYRVDVDQFRFFSPSIRLRLTTQDGYPVLRRGFESSVPGLHFVGAASAHSFGPVMRFVSGTSFTGSELASVLRARRLPLAA